MKINQLLSLAIFLFSFSVSAAAQSRPLGIKPTGMPLHLGAKTDMFVTNRAIDVSGFDKIDGSPFLSKETKKAFIKLTNGEKFSNVWIRFNIHNNELLLDNGKQFLALMNVDSAAYTEVDASGSLQNIILKTGYPAIEKNTESSIYQVLASKNSIQLLKYYKTKIEKVKTMGMPDKDAFVTQGDYYLYDTVSKSLREIKLNKKSVLGALSKFSSASEMATDLNTNFRNEKDVVKFISSLNM